MDLFNRHYWMSDNVYADADSPRAQLYIFNVIGVYKLSDVKEVSSGDTITGLQMTMLPNLLSTPSDLDVVQRLLNFGNSLLQAMDAWDDGYTISGYLSRAFEGVPSFAVAELLQDELITVSYVPEVLMQIENSMTVAPAAAYTADPNGRRMTMDVSKFIVTQNVTTNAVVSSNEISVENNFPGGFTGMRTLLGALPQWVKPLLNVRSDAPSVADNVIATRLHACPTYELSSENNILKITSVAGTEIPWQWNIFMKNGTIWEESPFWQVWSLNVIAVNSQVSLGIHSMLGVEQFDWHPFSFVITPNGSVFADTGISDTGTLCIMGDVYNATVVTVEMLANLHKICLYSELNSFGI